MRAAILVPPADAPTASDASSAIIGTLLEDTLASSTARRLVPLPAGAVTAALATALDIDANEHPEGVLMVIAGSHRLVDTTGAEALGFERALNEAAQGPGDTPGPWRPEGNTSRAPG